MIRRVVFRARGFASIAQPAADVIRERIGSDWTPKLGLVLGSGMGEVADTITDIKVRVRGSRRRAALSLLTVMPSPLACGAGRDPVQRSAGLSCLER
jgi:hypothetical protein